MDDDDIQEVTFDEAVRLDTRPFTVHVMNAMNELQFALHKIERTEDAIPIVNALGELEKFIGDHA